MRAYSFRIGGLSMAAVLLAMISPGQAQTPRPWVDPPPETGPAASPPPASTGAEAKPSNAPAANPAPASAPAAQAATVVEKEKKVAQDASASGNEKPASKTVQKKVLSDSKTRPPSRAVAVRNDRLRRPAQRRDVAEEIPRGTRAERIREGVHSGLEVMTLRTIELPDGRRIQILTRPRPGAVSELITSPE